MESLFAVSGRVWDWQVLDRIPADRPAAAAGHRISVSMALAALLVVVSVSWIIIWHVRQHKKKQHNVHLDGKILTRFHVWRFLKKTVAVGSFSKKRPGITP